MEALYWLIVGFGALVALAFGLFLYFILLDIRAWDREQAERRRKLEERKRVAEECKRRLTRNH
jgi:hypothetical protein